MPKNGHSTSEWISKTLRLAVYIRDGFRCCFCLTDLRGMHREMVTLDHLIPGAGDDPKNLCLACKSCNSRKGSLTYDEFLRCVYEPRTARRRTLRIHRLIEQPIGEMHVFAARAMLQAHRGKWPV